MKNVNRDLLVLTKLKLETPLAMKKEVDIIEKILYTVENLRTFCLVNEIIDLNRYKILSKPHLIQKTIRENNIKPFVFIFNKN